MNVAAISKLRRLRVFLLHPEVRGWSLMCTQINYGWRHFSSPIMSTLSVSDPSDLLLPSASVQKESNATTCRMPLHFYVALRLTHL